MRSSHLNIQSGYELSTSPLHSMLLQGAHTKVDTSPTQPITRGGICAKCKQSTITQSQVTFTRLHLTSVLKATILIYTIVINPKARAPKVSRLLCGPTAEHWPYTQVWDTFLLAKMEMHLHIDAERT